MLVYRKRRISLVIFVVTLFIFLINSSNIAPIVSIEYAKPEKIQVITDLAIDGLKNLTIKGRAPKTDYSREQFGTDWTKSYGCDTRNIILNRDLINVQVNEKCSVISGILHDPYTGKLVNFTRGGDTSSDVQIDHVVALSDAWQKGAQQLSLNQRIVMANDPLELLAVDGAANLEKSDSDAATWLPSNKSFRCQYVSRQIAVKQKYGLWVTQSEYDTIGQILSKCPGQLLPSP